jgi:GPH family glycoside/pentoside/hexuronide:cation symporter
LTENVETTKKRKYEYPKRIMASYGSRELFGQWISAAFGFTVFFFYENVIGLPTILAMWAYIIYSVWNAINDPLTGWLMEKIHMPWEKKNFKRFPWMLIGVIPWLLSYLFIYLVPTDWYGSAGIVQAHQLEIFLWYVISLCIYDTALTLYDVNVISLYPDKFSGLNERRTVQGFGTILGILGLVLAFILPSALFISTFNAKTYIDASVFSVVVGFFLFILVLPGIFEDKKVRKLYEQRKSFPESQHVESFFKSNFRVVKDRTFMMKAVFFFGYQVGGVMIQTSALYISAYLLGMGDDGIMFLLGAMLLGALISTPLWTYFAHKTNDNRKLSIIAGFILFATFLPMIFINGLIAWMIALLFFGVGIGGHWYVDPPTMGDVLDDVTVRTGKRQQAIYYGFQSFFIKFGQAFIAVTISLSHIFTGYVEGAPTQSPLALFGIRIHVAIVPAILVIVTVLLFWKYYKLTPDKVAANKAKLAEMGLAESALK